MENPLEKNKTSCPQDEVREPEQGKFLQSNTKKRPQVDTLMKRKLVITSYMQKERSVLPDG